MTHPHSNDDPLRNCSNDDIRKKSMNFVTRNANKYERNKRPKDSRNSLKMQQVRESNLRKNGHKIDNNIKLMLNSQASTTAFIFKFGNKANTPCRLRHNSNARVFKIRKSREYSQRKPVLSVNDSPTISDTSQSYHKALNKNAERKCSNLHRFNKNLKAL